MNHGAEPERDDYGLPPVDVDVPDDASELDADVQAYHRELRALRRQARSRRWRLRGSRQVLERTGLVMPLLAGCLVLAMLTGMVLTMFTANSYFDGASRSTPSALIGATVRLPSTQIGVDGQPPVVVSSLKTAALVVIPPQCGCEPLVQTLLQQASSARVVVYLIGARGNHSEISRLASGGQAGQVYRATDTQDSLLSNYRTGLTVLLVDSHGHATAFTRLRPGFQLQHELAALRSSR